MKASILVTGLVACFTLFLGFNSPVVFPSIDPNWGAVADSVQHATLNAFYSEEGQYVIQDNGGNRAFHYWWNVHVLVDAHLRGTDREEMMLAILKGIKSNNNNQFPNDYYDDMEWLASLRAYHATGNQEFLEATDILWEDITTGWNDHQGGGIAWRKNQLDYKNTPANAPAVILAARLYKERQKPEDLEWAKKIYQWHQHIKRPEMLVGPAWDKTAREVIDASTQLSGLVLVEAMAKIDGADGD